MTATICHRTRVRAPVRSDRELDARLRLVPGRQHPDMLDAPLLVVDRRLVPQERHPLGAVAGALHLVAVRAVADRRMDGRVGARQPRHVRQGARMTYAPGSLVRARERDWVVLPESSDDLLVLRPFGGTSKYAATST